ncbi:MAG TPA: hybrid sensor histidine kinase/response regulator [Bacteroidales bacterium]|nr:hybrid sensor histidine kinase/response regulator [Bacteroidales bacterium]
MENKHESENSSILIVDDNPQNLQVLGRLLQEQNYEIEFATSGPAALDWLVSRQFDLILLDINMPEMDGFEVCRRLRSDEKYVNIPIVFLSADNDRESILKGFELGGQDYITKPFDSRELLVRVRTHISLKDSRENLERLNRSLEEKVKERTMQLSIANENLEIMNSRLTELDNAKAEFLNLISHEIRTPLNGMILPVELLKDSGFPADAKELIDILDSSVKRLENFAINALLITRLKTRPLEISKNELDLEKLIDEVLDREKETIESRKQSVKKDLIRRKGKLLGEKDLVLKCIENIIENASVFSPSGGLIEIHSAEDADGTVLTIRDHGPGIPEEILTKGSEPFSKGNTYRDKSTGTGLPLAKMILEAHGGTVRIENCKDGGAQVQLKFMNANI